MKSSRLPSLLLVIVALLGAANLACDAFLMATRNQSGKPGVSDPTVEWWVEAAPLYVGEQTGE